MARIELAPEVLDDFERFLTHMADVAVPDAPARIGEIVEAIQLLAHSPSVGRPVTGGKRELVIGQGSRGCLALYRYEVRLDAVFVLAIRSQREAGYRRHE